MSVIDSNKTALLILATQSFDIPKEAVEMEVRENEIQFYDNEDYCGYVELYKPLPEYTCFEISIQEYIQFHVDYMKEISEFNTKQQEAVKLLFNISKEIEELTIRGLEISKATGVPFELNGKEVYINFNKIKFVDWYSSSMYC